MSPSLFWQSSLYISCWKDAGIPAYVCFLGDSLLLCHICLKLVFTFPLRTLCLHFSYQSVALSVVWCSLFIEFSPCFVDITFSASTWRLLISWFLLGSLLLFLLLDCLLACFGGIFIFPVGGIPQPSADPSLSVHYLDGGRLSSLLKPMWALVEL